MALAGKVMKIVEVMVEATEDTIAESSKVGRCKLKCVESRVEPA